MSISHYTITTVAIATYLIDRQYLFYEKLIPGSSRFLTNLEQLLSIVLLQGITVAFCAWYSQLWPANSLRLFMIGVHVLTATLVLFNVGILRSNSTASDSNQNEFYFNTHCGSLVQLTTVLTALTHSAQYTTFIDALEGAFFGKILTFALSKTPGNMGTHFALLFRLLFCAFILEYAYRLSLPYL